MAIRTSMAALINRVRSMIGDPITAPTFGDQDIQDILDDTRVTVRYAILRAEPTLGNGGILSFNDFYADVTDWEDSPATQIFGPSYQLLTPATADTLTGHYTFTLPAPGQIMPVFIVGQTYDRHLAAAELLERWAALLTNAYDYSIGSQSFKRSQQFSAKLALAGKYRLKARPKLIPMENSDVDSPLPFPYGNFDPINW